MQIVQESIELIRLRLAVEPEYREDTSRLLEEYFKGLFGRTVTVKVELAAEIPPEPSGKYRFAVCNIAQDGA